MADLPLARSGRIDLYFRYDLHHRDIASGLLLVREAGGVVSDWQGRPATLRSKGIIAANKKLHAVFWCQLK